MKMDVLLGLQWGDEGKGKVVDVLAPKYNTVARFQGGPNAGHTLEFDGIKHVLHQIPSGIFRDSIKNVIGNGVVLDPVIFKNEIKKLDPFNINFKDNLWISNKAQLILPTHRLLDAAYEKSKGNEKIGSTLKGIGPTYQDKIARLGLRVGDIFYDNFKEKYQKLVDAHKTILEFYKFEYDLEEAENTFFEAIEYLKTFNVSSTEYLINKELKAGKSVLAEGAQGSLLDVDFGSYPFVTSSNTMTAGVCTGLGVAPNSIQKVYGIFKAYCTRVGGGPFPTELFDEDGVELQKVGNEFGATTGRPRRCGWLDIPALKYVVMINGVTELFMMKADVLSGFEKIKVCTQYELEDGTVTDEFPYDIVDSEVKPIYEELEGWNCSLDNIDSFDAMPKPLKDYITYIEEKLGVPINLVSVGPDRTQTILR
ncbi:adenylosuccinate synthase [Marivirga salinae]|uniref:Adenylosuccinate synthetase n=1 Tax=Marivirga salinarum TaxID=3059078 RepID=A0AA51RE18_9BACT|nr:adenylosuccinate synthase [Marivirga sp. BDSF4-3]WMN11564.1 adenylosuccinate synthase [Marivirga sp. BDSF4-3]